MKKHLSLLINISSIALFIPGILLPMFYLTTDLKTQLGSSSFTTEIINKELSLLGTISELWQDERLFVAVLIALFSIAVPMLKATLMLFAYFKRHTNLESKLVSFVSKISKWSMADVFVVAVFLAVLSTNHSESAQTERLKVFGFQIDLLISNETLSMVGYGFYYFAGYCILSMIGVQLYESSLKSSIPFQHNDITAEN